MNKCASRQPTRTTIKTKLLPVLTFHPKYGDLVTNKLKIVKGNSTQSIFGKAEKVHGSGGSRASVACGRKDLKFDNTAFNRIARKKKSRASGGSRAKNLTFDNAAFNRVAQR